VDYGELFGSIVGEKVLDNQTCLISGTVVDGTQNVQFKVVGKPGGEFFIVARLDIFADRGEYILLGVALDIALRSPHKLHRLGRCSKREYHEHCQE